MMMIVKCFGLLATATLDSVIRQYIVLCCSPQGKSLSSRTNLQVLVLDYKVLENFQGLRILQTVRYV